MVTPILTTKLHSPSLRRNMVPRRRLVEQLDQGLHRKLTLVSAPAGFGKTTLLGEWLRCLEAGTPPPAKVAWISLDDGDNDPGRFWAYLSAALQRTDERVGQASADPFELAGSRLQELHLIKLINEIAVLPQAFVLVLDDYHLITAQGIHDAVLFLIEHLPNNLHLVLATRGDPPLPLPRLRAGGHLTELRQSDLRFTAEEAAVFLNKVMGLDLSATEVAALEARTEGWIAGLQMAALSMQGHGAHPDNRPDLIQAFTGSHRFVLDYLVEEVLEQQPAALQEFLLKTSISERLCGPLCDALVGERRNHEDSAADDSQAILEHLETANLFIVPLDDERRWYRYHRLFSDLLRKRLGQTSPDLVPALHRSASAWHEKQGLMAGAIDHALAGQDFERAATLIEESVEATLMRSEVTIFLKWAERLPDESLRRRPTLCFYLAWALLMSGRSPEIVEERLRVAICDQEVPESTATTTGRMAALRAYYMLFQADMDRAAELSHQALAHLPESDRFLRGIAAWISSLAHLFNGDLQEGSQALMKVVKMGEEMAHPLIAVVALCYQAKLQRRRGRLPQAQETLERALQMATDPQGGRLPIASEPLIGLAELEREWNELETAEDYLSDGIELAKQWSEMAAFDAYFPLARVRLAQGDVAAARKALDTALAIAHMTEATQVDDLVANLQQAHFLVTQGEVEGAMRWAEGRGLIPRTSSEAQPGLDENQDFVTAHLRKYEHLVLARLFILQRQASEALDLLDSLLARARKASRIDLIIEAQILRALAFQVDGHDPQALDAVAEALAAAEAGGYIRTFLDEGEPMARLLSLAAAQGTSPAYAAKLLSLFRTPASPGVIVVPSPTPAQPLIEPLSERELEVLRLLATGLSNPEIADELYIAVSTVRSHCKSIYGKLNVHSRWDAVQRGRELDLM